MNSQYLFLGLKNWLIKNSKIIIIVAIGLRLSFAFLYGTQDVEWWKAWYSSMEEKGLLNVYGATDDENIKLIAQGLSFEEIRKKTQNIIVYNPYKYTRTNYPVTQPPVYLYHVFIAGKLYRIFDRKLQNNRYYNFFLNLVPILYCLLTCVLIYWFLNSTRYKDQALISAVFYLFNPLIILNSPIQGYWDPVLGFFVIFSLILLYKKRLTSSLILFSISALVKPTAIVVSPVYIYYVIREHATIQIFKSLTVAFIVVFILASPFIFSSRFIGVALGVHSILTYSSDISRQSLNIWWPLQYYLNFWESNSCGIFDFLVGNNFYWNRDFPVERAGENLRLISGFSWLLATTINLFNAHKFYKIDRFYVFYFSFVQVYIYFMLRIGVQCNHYYIMMICYSLFCFFSREIFVKFVFLLLIFFAQDFIFYGFGRDFQKGVGGLNFLKLPFITVVISITNFFLFVKILIRPIKFQNS
jgi:Gpi18-like mannosyltransferase